jgi:hypothetical protein
MLEHYFDENIALARKHASLTWGDLSFTLMPKNTIRNLSQVNGTLNNAGNPTAEGKELILEQMHSKFFRYQILELLTDSARQAIEQQSSLYTWVTADKKKDEVDGLTILALILARICPNFKVVMYAKITKVKKITIAQYDNDVQLYFDTVKFLKLQIDQKDPTAYMEDAFIRDIFLQLKQESLPAEFCLEYSCQKTCWMMNKSQLSSQSLMDDASAYYVNLGNTGARKVELSRNTQIIALTTQLSELKTENSKLKASPKQNNSGTTVKGTLNNKYVFEPWRIERVNNKAEHNMIKRDGKTWYWCNKHKYNKQEKAIVTEGMYVTHKPEDHDAWHANCTRGKKGGSTSATPAASTDARAKPTSSSVINGSSAAKLSLSKSLQATLVTTAGITEDQFNKIWADACNALGN